MPFVSLGVAALPSNRRLVVGSSRLKHFSSHARTPFKSRFNTGSISLQKRKAQRVFIAAGPLIDLDANGASLAALTDTIQLQLYNLERMATSLTATQLDHVTPVSLAVVFACGLLTSFSPCTLSMLPICVAYIGSSNQSSQLEAAAQSACFALGIATTLAALGLAASFLGLVYGQIGTGLPIAVSVLSIAMGLNLLELLPFQLPSLGDRIPIPSASSLPPALRSYLIGLSFGLVASPCSTPVLAALLGYVSTTQDPVVGAALLLSYGAGYVVPLVLAGTFAGQVKTLLSVRKWSAWITPTSGAVLLSYGVFTLTSRLFES